MIYSFIDVYSFTMFMFIVTLFVYSLKVQFSKDSDNQSLDKLLPILFWEWPESQKRCNELRELMKELSYPAVNQDNNLDFILANQTSAETKVFDMAKDIYNDFIIYVDKNISRSDRKLRKRTQSDGICGIVSDQTIIHSSDVLLRRRVTAESN